MNKVFLIGNLTFDPELTTTNSGLNICKFNIAVTRRAKREEVDFVPITVFGVIGENCHKYLSKGSKVAVSGSLRIDRVDNEDGRKSTFVSVTAEEVQFLTAKGDGGDSSQYEQKKGKSKDIKNFSELHSIESTDDLPF